MYQALYAKSERYLSKRASKLVFRFKRRGSPFFSAVYERKTDKIAYAFTQRIEGYYHGTGDVFASAVTSGVLNGFTLAQSAQIAVDFTAAAILRTKNAGTDIRFGVNFEQEIPSFLKALKLV